MQWSDFVKKKNVFPILFTLVTNTKSFPNKEQSD